MRHAAHALTFRWPKVKSFRNRWLFAWDGLDRTLLYPRPRGSGQTPRSMIRQVARIGTLAIGSRFLGLWPPHGSHWTRYRLTGPIRLWPGPVARRWPAKPTLRRAFARCIEMRGGPRPGMPTDGRKAFRWPTAQAQILPGRTVDKRLQPVWARLRISAWPKSGGRPDPAKIPGGPAGTAGSGQHQAETRPESAGSTPAGRRGAAAGSRPPRETGRPRRRNPRSWPTGEPGHAYLENGSCHSRTTTGPGSGWACHKTAEGGPVAARKRASAQSRALLDQSRS